MEKPFGSKYGRNQASHTWTRGGGWACRSTAMVVFAFLRESHGKVGTLRSAVVLVDPHGPMTVACQRATPLWRD